MWFRAFRAVKSAGVGRGRLLLIRTLVVVAGVALNTSALAQAPVRLVVPFPPGGGVDRITRVLSPYLAEALARPVVENRPGGEGTIGAKYVARGEPDGSTLLLSNAVLIAGTANPELAFDARRDLRPVLQLTTSEHFLVANVSLGARDVFDLAALAKQRPGGFNCGAAPGMGAMGCEHLRAALGSGATIPYQGMAPVMKALLSGEVDLMFAIRDQLGALTASGRTRVLAAATEQRAAPPYDRLPLLEEAYPGLVLPGFIGVFVAEAASDAVVRRYNEAFNRVLALPEVRAALKGLDYDIVGGAPETMASTLARDLENYRRNKLLSESRALKR